MWLRSRLEKFSRLHYCFPQKPFQKDLGSQNKPAGKLITHVTHQKSYGFIVNSYREPEQLKLGIKIEVYVRFEEWKIVFLKMEQ